MKLNNKGFTLVEVIVAVALIVILSSIAIPNIISVLRNEEDTSYNIMIENIKTGAINMYEEISSNSLLGDTSNKLYKYNNSGVRTNTEIKITSNTITVNLQTLVSNGFVSGVNSDGKKIIQEPINKKNIGKCKITIKKNVSSQNKVTYSFTGDTVTGCPKTEDYTKGV